MKLFKHQEDALDQTKQFNMEVIIHEVENENR